MSDRPPRWIRRVDDAIYAAERALVVASMTTMVVIVFLDVVHRRLEAPESKLGALLFAPLRLLGVAADTSAGPSAPPAWIRGVLVPIVGAALLFGLAWLALATMRGRGASRVPARAEPALALAVTALAFALGWMMMHRPSRELYALVCLGIGAGVALRDRGDRRRATALALLSLAGAGVLYRVVPEGYSWSKEVAMILIVWVGLVGASMAAHDGRHIDIDFGKRLFPASLRRGAFVLGQLVHLGFCLFLVVLGGIYLFRRDGGLFHLGGRFPHTGIPDWLVALSIPVAFVLIALRVVVVALKVLGGDLQAKGSGPATAGAIGHGPGPATEKAP